MSSERSIRGARTYSLKDKWNVRIDALDEEYKFDIEPESTGRQLFEQVSGALRLRTTWPFGLAFVDTKGVTTWLNLKYRVFSRDVGKQRPVLFKFRVRFYPEDIQRELADPIAQRLLYLQTKSSILSGDLYTPADTAVVLASLAAQATHGPYSSLVHSPGFLSEESVLPQRILDEYDRTCQDWEDQIVSCYKDHNGMSSQTAVVEYLCVAEGLEMFGITCYNIRNRKGTELRLGVGPKGLSVYDRKSENSLSPKVALPWNEIKSIAYNYKKLVIKPKSNSSQTLVVYSPRVRHNKIILSFCMGNHELFLRRHQSITMATFNAQENIPRRMVTMSYDTSGRNADNEFPFASTSHDTQVTSPTRSVTGTEEVQLYVSQEDESRPVEPQNINAGNLVESEQESSGTKEDDIQESMMLTEEIGSGISTPVTPSTPHLSEHNDLPPIPSLSEPSSEINKHLRTPVAHCTTIDDPRESPLPDLPTTEPPSDTPEFNPPETPRESPPPAPPMTEPPSDFAATTPPEIPSPGERIITTRESLPSDQPTIEPPSDTPELTTPERVNMYTKLTTRESPPPDLPMTEPPSDLPEPVLPQSSSPRSSTANDSSSTDSSPPSPSSMIVIEDAPEPEVWMPQSHSVKFRDPPSSLEELESLPTRSVSFSDVVTRLETTSGELSPVQENVEAEEREIFAVEDDDVRYQNEDGCLPEQEFVASRDVFIQTQETPDHCAETLQERHNYGSSRSSSVSEGSSSGHDYETLLEDAEGIDQDESIGSEQYNKLKVLFEELSMKENPLVKSEGLEKYETLRNIRQGLTKTRTAVFEAM